MRCTKSSSPRIAAPLRTTAFIAAAALASVGVVGPLFAANDTYIGPPGGDWSTTSFWSPTGVPNAGDTVIFAPTGSGSYLYDGSYSLTSELTALGIGTEDASSSPMFNLPSGLLSTGLLYLYSGTLSQSGGTLNTIISAIADGGSATYSQSAGYCAPNDLILGYNGGTGTYSISGGSVSTQQINAGVSGGGAFLQSGTNSVVSDAGTLLIGGGGNAFYSISAGSLTVGSVTTVNDGTFSQTGSLSNSKLASLQIGSAAFVTLGGGSFTAGSIAVGAAGPGTLIQSTGSTNLGTVTVGGGSTSASSLIFNGGTLTSAATTIAGFGTYSQTGTLTFTNFGTFEVGEGTSAANANLSAGTFIATAVFIGADGTFTQTGGADLSGNISVGSSMGGGSIYLFSGGTISSSADISNGTFTQNGSASFDRLYNFYLGGAGSGSGFYLLSNGTLNVANGYVGAGGTYNQVGGFGSFGILDLGAIATLSGGYLSVEEANIGDGLNNGTFTQSNGSSNFGDLDAGVNTTGTILLSGGTLTGIDVGIGVGTTGTTTVQAGTLITDELLVGAGTVGSAIGFFNQTGGVGTVSLLLEVGQLSPGSLNLSGGTLWSALLQVGGNATGVFSQSGATSVASFSQVILGAASGSGTYALSAGSLSVGSMLVGDAAAGTFDQSGSLSISSLGTLDVGSFNGPSFVGLSGGSLSATQTVVGYLGPGTFSQSGSLSFSDLGTLVVGEFAQGSVIISGGTCTAGATSLGFADTFTESGSQTVARLGPVQVGNNGTLLLLGGTMNVQRISGAGMLEIAGGTLAITGAGSLGSGSIASAGLSISGTGVLDVGSSGLVIEYGNGTSPVGDLSFAQTARSYPANSIQRYAQTGINGLNWNGTGIISSFAENDPTGLTAVGVADENDLANVYPTDYTLAGGGNGTWMGQPINDTNNVLVRMTYYGDGNLDGVVNRFDVSALSQGYSGLAGYVGWSDGDYNYDGQINKNDVSLLAASYVFQGAPLGDAITPAQAQYMLALDPDMPANVKAEFDAIAAGETPEPASIGLLSFSSLAFLGRRRRKMGA
jgi:hypothetical protein